jgi:integrase
MKLDADTIKTLEVPPGKTDVIFFDDDLKGFGFRLRRDGGRLRRTWVAQYRAQGRTRRSRIGVYGTISATQARKAATELLAKVTLGRDPQGEKEERRKRAVHTLRAVADDYLAIKQLEVKKGEYRASSFRVTKLYLTNPMYFGPLHLMGISEISLADIATRLNAITRNNGTVTSGRARSALHSLFMWAAQNGLMGPDPRNPVAMTAKPKDATPRERVLSDTELAAIWRACKDDDFGRIVKLLTLTACRREEIGGLRWKPEIDLESGTLTLPKERVKNKHAHTLPLTETALSIIGTIPERVGRDHLFGDRSKTGFTGWDAAKADLDKRLGDKVADWVLHDLRRTAATWMAEKGEVETHIIEAVLNHYSGHRRGDAGTYNRARYKTQILAALSLWDDHLQTIVGGERKIVPFPQAQETA